MAWLTPPAAPEALDVAAAGVKSMSPLLHWMPTSTAAGAMSLLAADDAAAAAAVLEEGTDRHRWHGCDSEQGCACVWQLCALLRCCGGRACCSDLEWLPG